MNLFADFDVILKDYFFQTLSLVLSMLLFLTAYLSYKNYTLTTLSAYMKTVIMPQNEWKMDITGLIYPGEQYLDIMVTNGGPGIAKDLKWHLHINSSFQEFINPVSEDKIPYCYIGRDINLRSNNKIYSNSDRYDTKYILHIEYRGHMTRKKKKITFKFNGFGDLLSYDNDSSSHFFRVKT
jgi:hypothetical protein